MSAIAAYAVEADTAKELKKGSFKLYHQKTSPTNVVLLDIHDTDTEEVKYVKGLINQMRQELGSSTDLIKIEPETALFNILYTKKEVDQLIVSTGAGFNLPMFLHSVLISGANMIKLRSDTGEHTNAERYEECFSVTADNFEYVYLKLREYADKFIRLNETLQIFDQEIDSLTNRVEDLEETVEHIESCECDKEWMRFMKQNFKEGIFSDEIIVDGNIDLQGKHGLHGLTEMNTHNGVLLINGSLYTNDKITALNLPSQLTFRKNGLTEKQFITDDGIVDYNTYGKWYQACDIEAFGSVDVDNRLRINTLNSDKTSIIKTVDVGAKIDDFEYRIEALEAGGGGGSGGDGFWKINPTHMQSLPEHPALETYDFIAKASTVEVRNIDEDTIYVYFPDLTVDLSYDRAQFIEIKSSTRTYYISTKNNQMELPMITDYETLQEEMVYKPDLNHIGMLWKRQVITKSTTEAGKVNSLSVYWSVYYETRFNDEFLVGSAERPLTITLQEYNSSNELYRATTFTLTDEFDLDHDPLSSNENPDVKLAITGDPSFTAGLIYYIMGADSSATTSCKWIFTEYDYEITVDELVNRIRNHTITFEYTPDRDKIINNEPRTITSTELVKNETAINAPNTFDLHKYGGVKDYEIRLDKLVIDDKSVPSYNKISFKDFQIGGDYVGPIFTIYFGATRFMMNNEQILTPISCYLDSDGKYTTDQLLKKDGFWTTELVETDMPCFLWSKTAPITLQEAYNIGEITIKYIPRKSTLSTDHDVICREVIADNALDLYRSTSPNFYNPKLITEATHNSVLTNTETKIYYLRVDGPFNSRQFNFSEELAVGDELHCYNNSQSINYTVLIDTVNEVGDNGFPTKVALEDLQSGLNGVYLLPFMTEDIDTQWIDVHKHTRTTTNVAEDYYVIDFGYSTDSDEFKQLPEGFRFRFIDPVFSYNYEAVKENNDWQFKYGNLHPNVNTNRLNTNNWIDFSGSVGNDIEGPCIMMNNSNEIALTYLVKHCLGHNVSGWENMWKALWTDSRASITVTGPVKIHTDQISISKSQPGNQYCYIRLTSDGKVETDKTYSVQISLKIENPVQIDLSFDYSYEWTDVFLESVKTPGLRTIHDCYEVLNFSQHTELTFEYSNRGKGLRFYASPDFLLWNSDINYTKGTNIFRFLYDRDYVQIEPRPESCSALMTDKNIITDGIIVAQNLETHLHSLNQVANVTEETIQRMQYTNAVLGEIIENLAGLNDFVRLTILADFVCLGFSGLMGIVKFGEGIMKNGLRATLRLDEMPIISTAMRDSGKYTRIGESVTDMVQDARSMELVARDTLREEAQTIESQAIRHSYRAEEDFSLFAGGEFSTEASEISIASTGSTSFSSLEDLVMEAPNITINSDRATFGRLLEENHTLLAIDGSADSLATYGRTVGDYILGTFNRIGGTIKNGCGIVFNSANITSLLENIWWVLDTYKDAIGWSIQFGANIYKLCEFKAISEGLAMYFTPDRFIWSVVDASNIRTEHTIVGIAKYDEPSGWNDQKLITGQALLENYYSKSEIDSMLGSNNNSGSSNEIPSDLTINSMRVKQSLILGEDTNSWFGWIMPSQNGISLTGQLNIMNGALNVSRPETTSEHLIQGNVRFSGGEIEFISNVNFGGSVSGLNETITHQTNVSGEIGTFCETNGKLYDGYEKIGVTDCICQVKQSKSLNKKIVGIITSETQFASHGDVLVRVNDISDCTVGDILVPDENGCGKVASDQDLMFMMLHGIPRPKITCINTGIDNMVACFII